MSLAPFKLAPLATAHERTAFHCDSEPLNRYLREQVTQDVRRRVAACFVALANENRIVGYYTLASSSILLADLPAETCKRLPRYPTVPAVRLGRLAVDQAFKGQGSCHWQRSSHPQMRRLASPNAQISLYRTTDKRGQLFIQ